MSSSKRADTFGAVALSRGMPGSYARRLPAAAKYILTWHETSPTSSTATAVLRRTGRHGCRYIVLIVLIVLIELGKRLFYGAAQTTPDEREPDARRR